MVLWLGEYLLFLSLSLEIFDHPRRRGLKRSKVQTANLAIPWHRVLPYSAPELRIELIVGFYECRPHQKFDKFVPGFP